MRLIETLRPSEMFRMYAKSFDYNQLKLEIQPYCNYIETKRRKKFHYPALAFLLEKRVIVCTLCTAGVLRRANTPPDHFSYVFIDECASTHETMTLIPIAGKNSTNIVVYESFCYSLNLVSLFYDFDFCLICRKNHVHIILGLCTTNGKIHASIIVAGDPKQLDAVTRSSQAISMGFKTSFLEYLYNRPLYERNQITQQFNGEFITQLINNYRSHKTILKIPNELFYENTLLAKASESK